MLLKGNEKLMSITKPNDKLFHDAAGAILENWDKNMVSIKKGRYYDSKHGLNIKFNAYLNNKSRKIKTNVLL